MAKGKLMTNQKAALLCGHRDLSNNGKASPLLPWAFSARPKGQGAVVAHTPTFGSFPAQTQYGSAVARASSSDRILNVFHHKAMKV